MPTSTGHLIMMDLLASIQRFCSDWAESEGGGMKYEDFDAHADESSVPPGDLIGSAGFSLSTNHPFVDVDVMIGISTQGDTNILRLREAMARLFQRLQPMQRVNVLDFRTGDVKGVMIVQDGMKLLPVEDSGTRPIQYLMVGFKTDCFAY